MEKWTKEKCTVIAKQFTTRKKFQIGDKNAYASARYNGWLDEICQHMLWGRKPDNYWTKEKCLSEALKHKKRSEFKKSPNGAYYRALMNGWLDDICVHMTGIKYVKRGLWNKNNCLKEALKYKTRTEFKLGSNGAYDSAKRNGWLNEVCQYMKPLGNRYKRCIYGYFFSDNTAYVGLTYNTKLREISRKSDINDPVIKHIKETNLIPKFIILNDFVDVGEAIKLERTFFEKYKNNGWNMLNVAKTGSIGSGMIKWTYERCKEEAKKCVNKQDFLKKCIGAYYASYRNKWLDNFFVN